MNTNKQENPETVHIDDDQLQYVIYQLSDKIDESVHRMKWSNKSTREDLLSWIIKVTFGGGITAFGILLIISIFLNGKGYWDAGINGKLATIVSIILSIEMIIVGVDFLREKDRMYIVTAFSSIAAAAAVIVALLK